MKKLINFLSEYFLGTETHRQHKQERAWSEEFIFPPEILRLLKRQSYSCEAISLIVGKVIPNLIDAVSLYYFVSKNYPPYGLFFGEGIRLIMEGVTNSNLEIRQKQNKRFEKRVLDKETLEDLEERFEEKYFFTNSYSSAARSCSSICRTIPSPHWIRSF